jgi:hypothetical protein
MAADVQPTNDAHKFSRYRSVRRTQQDQVHATSGSPPPLPSSMQDALIVDEPVQNQHSETVNRSMSRYHRRPQTSAGPSTSRSALSSPKQRDTVAQQFTVPPIPQEPQSMMRMRAQSSGHVRPDAGFYGQSTSHGSPTGRVPGTRTTNTSAAGDRQPKDAARELLEREAERQRRMKEKIKADKRARLEEQERELERKKQEEEEAERLRLQQQAEEENRQRQLKLQQDQEKAEQQRLRLEEKEKRRQEQEAAHQLREQEKAREKQRKEEEKIRLREAKEHERATRKLQKGHTYAPESSPPPGPNSPLRKLGTPPSKPFFGSPTRNPLGESFQPEETPSNTRPRQVSGGNDVTIKPGGGGVVPGTDAPISAVNAGDRVCYHMTLVPLTLLIGYSAYSSSVIDLPFAYP